MGPVAMPEENLSINLLCPDRPVRRIVIFRPAAIGDTLLTFPALRALRSRFPEAEMTAVGNRPALELARTHRLIDHVDAFGADWVSDLFGDAPTPDLRARLGNTDLGIVWMHTAAAASELARVLEATGVSQVLPAASFPAPDSKRHLANHLYDTLQPLGMAGPRPIIRLGAVAGSLPLASPPPLTIFHPGAGGQHKRWPAARYAELAQRCAAQGAAVAVTQGPADEEAVAEFLALAGDTRPRLLAGLKLTELAAELGRAARFIGNDSGITHLAALIGVPTLALFGPYDPAYWAPIGDRVGIVDAGIACPHRGDPREGCRRCHALADLEPEAVWEAMEALEASLSPSVRTPVVSSPGGVRGERADGA